MEEVLDKKEVVLNQIKSKCLFDNLKSDYFLKNVFNNIKKKKFLKIIKCNKKIKNKLNINLNNYKEYCEKYTPIELEIIPFNNKYGKFINIKKEDEIYFHIYFNDNKDEIKRNTINKNDKTKKINIIIDYQITSLEHLFNTKNKYIIESINFKKFYRNNIISMRGMFLGCSSLKNLNLSSFNTENVTDMNYMFCGCSSLEEINLSKFNTNKVTNIERMFS